MEHDIQKALNMKLIFCIFEQLKNNFHKKKLFCFGKAKDTTRENPTTDTPKRDTPSACLIAGDHDADGRVLLPANMYVHRR
jgi:hypothetical protein